MKCNFVVAKLALLHYFQLSTNKQRTCPNIYMLYQLQQKKSLLVNGTIMQWCFIPSISIHHNVVESRLIQDNSYIFRTILFYIIKLKNRFHAERCRKKRTHSIMINTLFNFTLVLVIWTPTIFLRILVATISF